MARRLAGIVMLAAWLGMAAGCHDRCAELATMRASLAAPRPGAPGPHAELSIPLARANAFLAEVVQAPPVQAAIELPSLGPLLPLGHHALTAVARSVVLRPAADDRLRFALRIELLDGAQPLTTLAVETEVAPRLVRDGAVSELVAGLGPETWSPRGRCSTTAPRAPWATPCAAGCRRRWASGCPRPCSTAPPACSPST